MLKISKLKIYFVLTAMLLFLVLVASYLSFITKQLSYAGLISNFDNGKFIFSCLVVFFSSCLVNLNKNNVSGIGQLIILCMMIMPIFAFWACSGRESNIPFMALFSYLIISFIVLIWGGDQIIKVRNVKYSKYIIYFLCIAIVLLLVLPLLRVGMLTYFSLGITDVYLRRGVLSSGALSNLGGYLLAWSTKIIIPSIVVYSFVKRDFFIFLFFCLLQIFIFGLTGHKEQIINLFVVVGIAYLLMKDVNITSKAILWIFFICFSLFFIGTSYENEFGIISTALFSRAFFSVAINHFEYYDFIANNEFVYWSNSFLSGLYNYPYAKSVPEIVGFGRYREGVENVANAGFIASGYMHFGIIGVLIYSVVIGFIFKLCDLLIDIKLKTYQIPICTLAFLQLVNGDLTTSLLTHGIALMIFIIFLLRK